MVLEASDIDDKMTDINDMDINLEMTILVDDNTGEWSLWLKNDLTKFDNRH